MQSIHDDILIYDSIPIWQTGQKLDSQNKWIVLADT